MSTRFSLRVIIVSAILICISPDLWGQPVIRVNSASACTVGCDGSDWSKAYPRLQDALAAALAGDELWVAKGTYFPDEGALQTEDNKSERFALLDGVKMYGGFTGVEADRHARDWHANQTILSGQITASSTGRSYTVVSSTGVGSSTVLDGFVITRGYAPSSAFGAGMTNDNASPTLRNLWVVGNYGSHGGGIQNKNGSSPTVTNSVISYNGKGTGSGGGMYNTGSSSPVLVNVTFSMNYASQGTNIANIDDSNPSIVNTIVADRSVQPDVYNDASSPVISHSLIEGSGGSGAGWDTALGTDGGGNLDGDPMFADADGLDDVYGTLDDDVSLTAPSPAIETGDNSALPADVDDLDGDMDTTEPIPFDFWLKPRVIDSGPDGAVVDMGAREYDPMDDLLHVELTDVAAISKGQTIRINWTTLSESNCVGFVVEHRESDSPTFAESASVHWEELAVVACMGSATMPYEYSHPAVGLDPGEHTFRLRVLEMDGRATYSTEVSVLREMVEAFRLDPVYPNPARDLVNIRFGVRESQQIRLELFDATGRRIRTLYSDKSASSRINHLLMDTRELSSGPHILRLSGSSFNTTKMMMVVR